MRTDVKIGMVGSVVVAVLAGWYFTGRDKTDAPIAIEPTADESVESAPLLVGTADQEDETPSQTTEPYTVPSGLVLQGDEPAGDDHPSDQGVLLPELFSPSEEESDQPAAPDEQPDDRTDSPDAEQVSPAPTQPMTQRRSPAAEARRRARRPRTTTAPASTVRPRRTTTTETHTVQAGDTFARLARIYYGDVRHAAAIREANPQIVDPTSIAVGTVVYIPEIEEPTSPVPSRRVSPAARPSQPSARTYTVREGDSLYGIARDKLGAGSRWEELYKLNKAAIGDNPARLKVGQVLTLPSS